MVKLVFLCRRRADISHERYVELLLNEHVPVALRHHLTLRKYVVNVVEASLSEAAPLDSIGELCFDSLEDFTERLYDSVDGQRVVQADVARFMGHVDAYVVRERVAESEALRIVPGNRSPGLKRMTCFRRRAELTSEAFALHWGEHHTPLVLTEYPPLTRYTTNIVVTSLGTNAPPWDGIESVHLKARDDEPGHIVDAVPASIERDRARFIGAMEAYTVAEYVQKIP